MHTASDPFAVSVASFTAISAVQYTAGEPTPLDV